ncbi:interferon epsilon-like [Ornithorhynchus anatinus]|uniref:Interferon, kappa n=1 Tax=Ornithorhynchus anatinus TaxID=9258 RepID=A8E6D7_ORNAN|nr:interferon kappa precursor [Ornithorhynchus anatinus]XP_028910771.1 interferon epsilon-like [Ornithorhynchus anatinus]CAM33451.1 TPA: type I interferon 2 [Ornithorhynchus anatinus]
MTNAGLIQIVLVLLVSTSTVSLSCSLLHTVCMEQSLKRLDRMQGKSLLSCLKDRKDFQLPQELVEAGPFKEGNRAVAVHELLQQIFTIFSQNLSQTGWDQSEVENFLHGLHRQLEELEVCAEQGTDTRWASVGSDILRLRLKSYFRSISLYLRDKDYSSCAWEIVRAQIRRCIFQFMRRLRN